MNYLAWYMFVFLYFPLLTYCMMWVVSTVVYYEIKEDYIFIKRKRHFIEKLASRLYLIIVCFVPIFNLLMFIMMLDTDTFKKRVITRYLKEKRIEPKLKERN